MGITDLILAISHDMRPGKFQSILTLQEEGMNMAPLQDTYESLTNRVTISLLAPDWEIRSFIARKPTSGLYRLSKRLMDLAISLVGMVGLIVLFPFLALIISIDSKGPIIFKQIRLGRGGAPTTYLNFAP